MLKLSALTGGINFPSARYRVRQYIKPMEVKNIKITEYSAKYNSIPPASFLSRLAWFPKTLLERRISIIKASEYDLVLLQRELISSIFILEKFIKKPIYFDVDDAIWLNFKFNSQLKIVSKFDKLICGNDFIGNYFSKYNKNIFILPTPVNTDLYFPIDKDDINEEIFYIGWVGSSSGFIFFDNDIQFALNNLLNKYKNWKFLVISDIKPQFAFIDNSKIVFKQWDPNFESDYVNMMDIGLMPLNNTDWSKGKCSYKMLIYMACGIPVVVSNYGMNTTVLNKGDVGFGCIKKQEWYDSIDYLINNENIRKNMGACGRKIVLQYYSLNKCVNDLVNIIQK